MSTVFQENEDLFDNLPDAILLTIFDKVEDAKSLCISSSLCKRFCFLITQTHNISLTIQPQKLNKSSSLNSSPFLGFFNSVFLKPFRFLLRQINILNPILHTQKKCVYSCCTCSYSSPAENLKSFTEIKKLEIRIPSPPGDQSLLKWKAGFGSQLKNCLIVGATSISPVRENRDSTERNDSMEFCSNRDETFVEESVRMRATPISPVRENRDRTERNDSMEFESLRSSRDETFVEETVSITNGELKLRIVWTISCLIAASARHCLLEETIKEKKTINRVVITDDMGQGKCCMNGEQLEEMRNTAVISSNRSKFPVLKVKMWYVPELELPVGGCVVKGATLVVVKPVEEWNKVDDGGELVAGGFGIAGEGGEEMVFDEVAREMVKLKSSYTLEMNSF